MNSLRKKKNQINRQIYYIYWHRPRWPGYWGVDEDVAGIQPTFSPTHILWSLSLYRSSAFHVCRRPPLQTPLARNPSQIFSSFLSLKQKRKKKQQTFWDVFSLSGGRLGFRIGNDDDGLGERCAHLNRWWLRQQQQPASSTKERWGQNNNKRKRKKKHKRQKDGFTVLLVCTHTNTHTRNRVENPCRSLQWPQTDDSVNTNRADAITSTPFTAASKSLLSSISHFFFVLIWEKKNPQKFNDVIGAATSRKKRLTSRTSWLGFKNRTRLGATQVHMKCSLSRPRSTK